MKKIIVIIIMFISIITIPGVKAEECENLITKGQNWIKTSSGNFVLNYTGQDQYIKLEPATYYTIFFDYGEEKFEDIINTTTAVQNFQIWRKHGNGIVNEYNVDLTGNKYTFETRLYSGTDLQHYFRMNGIKNNTATTPFIDNKSHEFWLVKGKEICRTKPEPEPVETAYSSFITLYTDRLNYLAEGFTSNPYLIAMIGIIFAFIVLELFLKILHLRGGK